MINIQGQATHWGGWIEEYYVLLKSLTVGTRCSEWRMHFHLTAKQPCLWVPPWPLCWFGGFRKGLEVEQSRDAQISARSQAGSIGLVDPWGSRLGFLGSPAPAAQAELCARDTSAAPCLSSKAPSHAASSMPESRRLHGSWGRGCFNLNLW